jgi:uncharacterized protein YfkK (UPF0435 family)
MFEKAGQTETEYMKWTDVITGLTTVVDENGKLVSDNTEGQKINTAAFEAASEMFRNSRDVRYVSGTDYTKEKRILSRVPEFNYLADRLKDYSTTTILVNIQTRLVEEQQVFTVALNAATEAENKNTKELEAKDLYYNLPSDYAVPTVHDYYKETGSTEFGPNSPYMKIFKEAVAIFNGEKIGGANTPADSTLAKPPVTDNAAIIAAMDKQILGIGGAGDAESAIARSISQYGESFPSFKGAKASSATSADVSNTNTTLSESLTQLTNINAGVSSSNKFLQSILNELFNIHNMIYKNGGISSESKTISKVNGAGSSLTLTGAP